MKKILLKLLTGTVVALCLCGCAAASRAASASKALQNVSNSTIQLSSSTTYFMYVGLNDSTTGKQVLSTDAAIEKVKTVLKDQKQGATVLPAWGDYLDQSGAMQSNDTVLVIVNGEEAAVLNMVDPIRKALNVSVVYIEKHNVENAIINGMLKQQ